MSTVQLGQSCRRCNAAGAPSQPARGPSGCAPRPREVSPEADSRAPPAGPGRPAEDTLRATAAGDGTPSWWAAPPGRPRRLSLALRAGGPGSHGRGLWWMSLLHELGTLHPGLPALRPAPGLVDLYHEEGQDHHGSQEGEHGDGLAHLLVVAAGHDPSRNVPGTALSGRQWSHLRAARAKVG